jgi:hypothetical protein
MAALDITFPVVCGKRPERSHHRRAGRFRQRKLKQMAIPSLTSNRFGEFLGQLLPSQLAESSRDSGCR